MPVSTPVARSGGQITCYERVKLGFMMGAFVGCGAGILFGGFSSFRFVDILISLSCYLTSNLFVNRAGLRGMDLVNQTAKTMFQGAGTFGTFMAIGSAIRC